MTFMLKRLGCVKIRRVGCWDDRDTKGESEKRRRARRRTNVTKKHASPRGERSITPSFFFRPGRFPRRYAPSPPPPVCTLFRLAETGGCSWLSAPPANQPVVVVVVVCVRTVFILYFVGERESIGLLLSSRDEILI